MISSEVGILHGLMVLLLIVTLLSLGFWGMIGTSAKERMNRIGIILELLGILSAVPEIIGEDRLRNIQQAYPSKIKQSRKQLRNFLRSRDVVSFASSCFDTSGIAGFILLLANFLTGLLLIGLGTTLALYPDIVNISSLERTIILIYGLLALTWTALLLIDRVFVVIGKESPAPLIWIFAGVHLYITFISIPIAAALAKLALVSSKFALRLPLRQVIIRITIPFVVLGNLFQLIATFL